MTRKLLYATLALVAITLHVGCGGTSPVAPQAQKAETEKTPAKGEDHGHKTGAHGGSIFSIGADNYHAEVRFEAEGLVRLFLLDRDEAKVLEVEKQSMTAYARAEGSTESVPFEIGPDPQADDAPGKTSQFVGRLPKELWGKPLALTVPLKIAGERFRPTFTPRPSTHAGMPQGVVRGSENERALYLKPGGIYTAEDIQANGATIPSEKFAGVSWPHDDDLKAGDKVCPVTDNKADTRCSWVVNGKKYEFCCAPCLDKFVGWAKNQPGRIREPEDYVYRD